MDFIYKEKHNYLEQDNVFISLTCLMEILYEFLHTWNLPLRNLHNVTTSSKSG